MFESVATVLGLVFATYVALIVVTRVRRNLRRRRGEKPVNYDFTIGELNDLLRTGRISPEEFEKAKASVLKRAATAAAAAALPPATRGARGFDVIQNSDEQSDGSDENR